MAKEVVEKAETTVDRFSKEQILASKKYAYRRDALGAILEDGKEYTFAEVDDILDKFMKGQVK